MLICILCAVSGLVGGAVLGIGLRRRRYAAALRTCDDLVRQIKAASAYIKRKEREWAVERDKLQTRAELAEQRYRMEHNLNRASAAIAAGTNPTAKDG